MVRFLLAVLAISPLGAQLLVETYAGGVIRTGVPANAVALETISGIAWDPSGNIVFADTNNNVIRRIRPDGIMETIVGSGITGFAGDGGPALSAAIHGPKAPAYDQAGNLYFYDSNNYRIRRVDGKGVIATVAGDGQAPTFGLDQEGPATSRSIDVYFFAVDPTGIVYFADGSGNILRVTTAGNLEMFAPIPFAVPGGLATDSNGNVYFLSQTASYQNPHNLYRVSPSGAISTVATYATSPLPPPGSFLTSDLAGNVYAYVNGQLNRYAPDGTATIAPTPGVIGTSAINANGTIALLAGGIVPVIQTFTAQSVLTTVGGANPQPAPDGTPLQDAWFLDFPVIAFSHTGDLYASEIGACLIRKITPAGVLSKFAGTGTCGTAAPSGNAKTANLSPRGIAIDSQNNVWATQGKSFVYAIAQDGTIFNVMSLTPSVSYLAIAIDSKDRVYVAADQSVSRLLSGNSWQTIVSGTFILGLGTDASGNVYVTEAGPNTYLVNDDGSLSLKYPNFGEVSFVVDAAGNAWECNGDLKVSNPSGIADVGSDETGFSGDGGPVQSARLQTFDSIAAAPDGTLYFEEFNRIRRITGSGPSARPVISQNGIVNAVSYAGGPIAPGELISIFGSNFGASALQVNAAVNNRIPVTIGRTKVLFNGIPGAITAITANQINVFVAYEVKGPVSVQVQVDNTLSTGVSIPLAEAAPGLSPSVLNQDGTVNSASNPAPRGTIVSFYGTGLGAMSPQLNDGYLAISTPYSMPVNSPSLSIGGQPAQILYAGDAPTLPTGVFQINATIPTAINPGPASVSLTMGGVLAQGAVSVK